MCARDRRGHHRSKARYPALNNNILARLDAARAIADMDLPGFRAAPSQGGTGWLVQAETAGAGLAAELTEQIFPIDRRCR